MSKERDRASTPARVSIAGLLLFSLGLYGIVLGEAIQLLLESNIWPGATGDDAFIAPLLGSLGLIFLASMLILAGLFCLKVHWLAVLATFLIAFFTAYGQGRIFPTNPGYYSLYWFLTYGGLPYSIVNVIGIADLHERCNVLARKALT
jgi:hypothetical protein